MSDPTKRGKLYWCIKVPKKISEKEEILGYADEIEVTPSGVLILWCIREGKPREVNLALAPGQWILIYAASCLDGAPVAVDHWKGEVS